MKRRTIEELIALWSETMDNAIDANEVGNVPLRNMFTDHCKVLAREMDAL